VCAKQGQRFDEVPAVAQIGADFGSPTRWARYQFGKIGRGKVLTLRHPLVYRALIFIGAAFEIHKVKIK